VTPHEPAILVLGVGNTLMRDDGVGVRLMEALCAVEPALPGVEYVDAGTLSFLLLPMIEQCRALLVLDAARLGGAPGEVRELGGAGMDEFLESASCSVHEIGLRDLLDAARLTESLPARRALVGVQPDRVDWGETLSPPVAAAVPPAVALARGILERWQREVAS
jgi:hydrogenase maturation protease